MKISVIDYMKIAIEEAWHSNDPKTKVGCLYVDENNNIISKGHNSVNIESNIDLELVSREFKRYLMTHAEVNALSGVLSSQYKFLIAYCTLAPCIDCLKLMSKIGVKTIYYNQLFGSNKTINKDKIHAISLLIKDSIEVINYSKGVTFCEEVLQLT